MVTLDICQFSVINARSKEIIVFGSVRLSVGGHSYKYALASICSCPDVHLFGPWQSILRFHEKYPVDSIHWEISNR